MNHRSALRPQSNLRIDLSRHVLIEYLVGPSLSGPSKCIKCHRSFKAGEPWRRLTSPVDPQLGSYRVGVHTACSPNARRNGSGGTRPRHTFRKKRT